MAILRRSKKKPPAAEQIANLQVSMENCTKHIEELQRENEIHISRMAAMQAEIDHLRAQLTGKI